MSRVRRHNVFEGGSHSAPGGRSVRCSRQFCIQQHAHESIASDNHTFCGTGDIGGLGEYVSPLLLCVLPADDPGKLRGLPREGVILGNKLRMQSSTLSLVLPQTVANVRGSIQTGDRCNEARSRPCCDYLHVGHVQRKAATAA